MFFLNVLWTFETSLLNVYKNYIFDFAKIWGNISFEPFANIMGLMKLITF